MIDLVSDYYPGTGAGGFSRRDGIVQFYRRVRALLKTGAVVLDFGAGRGAAYYEDRSSNRRGLRDLRGEGRHVIGADVDPVSTNPWINEAVVLDSNAPLAFENMSFEH